MEVDEHTSIAGYVALLVAAAAERGHARSLKDTGGTVHTDNPKSKDHTARHHLLATVGVALPALLCSMVCGGGHLPEMVFAAGDCTSAPPGASDYCDSSRCGPCAEGGGDCEPGQCRAGLDCVEEGAVDHCRPTGGGASNLQVRLDGVWKGVCCDDSRLAVSDRDCWWTEYDRTLTDEPAGLKLDCPEGGPADCECNGSGERMHGIDGDLDSSIDLPDGGPMYSNYGEETCVVVDGDGELKTAWTSSSCTHFRLR